MSVLLLGGIAGIGVAVVAWGRREHPAAGPLAKMALLPALSAFASAGLVLLSDMAITRGLLAFSNAALMLSAGYFLLFALVYTGRDRELKRDWKNVIVGVYGFGVMIVVLDLYVWTGVSMQTVSGLTLPVLTDQTVTSILTFGLAYPAVGLGIGLLGSFLVSSSNMYRKQTAVILLAVMVTVAGSVFFEVGVSPHPGLNLTPLLFTGEAIIIVLALFKYEFLNVEPMAPDIVLEEISDPVIVLDEDDRVVDANPPAELLLDDPDSIGLPLVETLPALATVFEENSTGETQFRTDGNEIKCYDVNDAPIRDQYGRDRGAVLVLRDVTLQQRREQTLESLQSVTQQFLTAATAEEIVEIAVAAGNDLLDCPYSGAMLYDEQRDQLRSTAFAEPLEIAYRDSDITDSDPVVEPGDSDVWQVFATGEPQKDVPIEPGDGNGLPIDIGGSLLYPLGEHGVLGLSSGPEHEGFSEDDYRFAEILAQTTENALDRIENEEQLRENRQLIAERNEQLEFFNGVLRHDLLNGMHVIQAHTDQLDELVDGQTAEHVKTIDTWSRDITTLAQQVRSASNIIAGECPANLGATDVSKHLREKAEKIRDSYPSVTVEVGDGIDDLPLVRGDDLLAAVVENLVVNAVDHNDTDSPAITIDGMHVDGTVTIRIADNGPGIDDEIRSKIFEERFTGDQSGSIGFGLYFVRVMIDRYGGGVRFENNEPRGSVAVLELPTAEQPVAAPQ
ncbi:MAG: histidine kinase N-terminal 7TM domain-containing protein [Halapricum sp.]